MFGEGKSGSKSHIHLCVTQSADLGKHFCWAALWQMAIEPEQVHLLCQLIGSLGYEDVNYIQVQVNFRQIETSKPLVQGQARVVWASLGGKGMGNEIMERDS